MEQFENAKSENNIEVEEDLMQIDRNNEVFTWLNYLSYNSDALVWEICQSLKNILKIYVIIKFIR